MQIKVCGVHGRFKLLILNHGLQKIQVSMSNCLRELGKKLGPFDLAIIPIGTYGPRYFMLPMHVDPDQAVLTHKDVRSKKSIPLHWGIFQLSYEPFLEPPALLAEALKKNELHEDQFNSIKIGETVELKDFSE